MNKHLLAIGHNNSAAASLKAMTTPQTDLIIREFRTGDEVDFRRLNEEWITRHFAVEPREAVLLADPQGTVLDRGGRIFLAVQRRPDGWLLRVARHSAR